MSAPRDVRVPDIGEFEDVDVIEVLVTPGDRVEADQSLITLESDKATMEIPSPAAGVVREVVVEVGSRVSQGSLILRLEAEEEAEADEGLEEGAGRAEEARDEEAAQAARGAAEEVRTESGAAAELPEADLRAEVLVLGSGPGGYTAAFRAADLGKRVVLVERYPTLGGVCLNVGCIPSKALLHLAEVVTSARAAAEHGVVFGAPELDPPRIRGFVGDVVGKLTDGLAGLAKRRRVEVVQGEGRFEGPHLLRARSGEGEERTVAFEHAIVAVGSRAAMLPDVPDDPRIVTSTGALEIDAIPERLLVIGGGIIGLEMAAVYHAFGTKVTVVELLDQLMAGADADLVKPLHRIIASRYEDVLLGTKVTGIEAADAGLRVSFEGPKAPEQGEFDRVLVAVGRRPNGDRIGAGAAGLRVDERGFLPVDEQQRTHVPHVFAIGDVTGEPMLAHRATHQGRVAAEVIAGHRVAFDARAVPSVAYTDPEVAWMGLTEAEAKRDGVAYEKAVFPWSASGRALGMGRSEGATKLLLDPETRRVLGGGAVGVRAGDLIAELVLALEMGADAQDVALSIHPHPTLSETIAFAAELAEGTITDLMPPRKHRRG